MNSQFPFAKIKRIMKFDPDVDMVNREAVASIGFATDLFVSAFCREIYMNSRLQKRKTIQVSDVENVVSKVPWLEFLDGAMDTWEEKEPQVRTGDAGTVAYDETVENTPEVSELVNSVVDEMAVAEADSEREIDNETEENESDLEFAIDVQEETIDNNGDTITV